MKPKVILTNKLLIPAIKHLSPTCKVIKYWESTKNNLDLFLKPIKEHIQGAMICPLDVINTSFIRALPNLKIISLMGAGLDRVDIKEAQKRNIVITTTSSIGADDVADLAMGLLIALARRIFDADRFVRSKMWNKDIYELTGSLAGKNIGIVGLGNIGREIAKRASAFNLLISYWGRTRKPDVPYEYIENLLDLAKKVDFLIISCAGTTETRHLINYRILQALGKNSFIINVSRGFVIHEKDLILALDHKIIAGAALDVFEHEPNVPEFFLKSEQVILQPHVGSATYESREKICQLAANNLIRFFEQGGHNH